jgi:hypothetical protein
MTKTRERGESPGGIGCCSGQPRGRGNRQRQCQTRASEVASAGSQEPAVFAPVFVARLAARTSFAT